MKKKVYTESDILAAAEMFKLFAVLPKQEQERFFYMIKGVAVVCGVEVRA